MELLNLNRNTNIEFMMENNLFLGIGRVQINNMHLRGENRPMFVEITTPDGINLFDYKLIDSKRLDDGGMIMELHPQCRAGGGDGMDGS